MDVVCLQMLNHQLFALWVVVSLLLLMRENGVWVQAESMDAVKGKTVR
jgi:hypothetical protein